MANMRGLEGEELLVNLRQLISSFEPYIREAGSSEQAEETLLHLEESDENFHKHELVKNLKRKVDELLSPLIDEELEKYSSAGHVDSGSQETLVTRITTTITQSRQFTELMKRLKRNIEEAASKLSRNFDNEFGSGQHSHESWVENNIHVHGLEDEEGSDSGSVMMLDTSTLKAITDNLAHDKSLMVKREAMQKLNRSISGDVFNNDHWSQLKTNLTELMADPDVELTNLTLKFLAKSYSCTSHHTSEVYAAHAEYLKRQFLGDNPNVPMVKNGLDCAETQNLKLIKAFYLMNQFQQETPNYWVRYPTQYMEKIIDSTLSLLSSAYDQRPGCLTPVHYIAVIDPKARWVIKWMHGFYSRSELFKALRNYHTIIEDALVHCLDFSASHKMQPDLISDITSALNNVSLAGEHRLFFTGDELQYAYFIHSLFFLSRLLFFSKGREFFPIKIPSKHGTVTRSQLLKAWVLLIVDPGVPALHRPSASTYEVASLVTEVLKELLSNEQACKTCLFQEEIVSILLSPLAQLLDETSGGVFPSENTLLHVADILCVLASSTRGRRYLMHGESLDLFSRTETSAAHLIVEFTKKALLKDLPRVREPPSPTVIGAYLYVCRQLYNTCEGLFILYKYDLHTCLAQAWRETLQDAERTSTPTPSDTCIDDNLKSVKEYSILFWEDVLRDNLLNFASTAKGILLLQQTGTMNECVSYMYQRYEKKLQVSKCEKFGYGCMVTQVAATAPGMVALQNTGYIAALLKELWSSLECGPEDAVIFMPPAWPVEHVDRNSQKHFTRLMNILSGFPAVYEVLKGQPLPTKNQYTFRDIPDTIAGLLDRLAIIDSPEKVHSLFNFEQSHCFGLRLLSVMVSCLDTYLLLQSQYKFEKVLLDAQAANKPEDRDEIIIDMLSVERNYLLVKCHLLGGPSERIIPPRTLLEGKDCVYPYPLYSSLPMPRQYIPNLTGRATSKQETELSKFLSSKGEKKGPAWLEKCRSLVMKSLSFIPDLAKGTVLQQVLEEGVAVLCTVRSEAIFPQVEFAGNEGSIKNFKLSPLHELGIETAIRYGRHLKVINSSSDAKDSLTHLVKQTGCFLKQQQKTSKNLLWVFSLFRNVVAEVMVDNDDGRAFYSLVATFLKALAPVRFLLVSSTAGRLKRDWEPERRPHDGCCLSGAYPGFDWLTATVFLIFHGNHDRAWGFLHRLSELGCSAYLWPARMHASVHLPAAFLTSGIHPIFSSTAHNIELILQVELPLITSAFKMSGYTPAQICVHWLKQCFWNYLDWGDIVLYICTVLIMGVDYQAYFCVAALKHLQQHIMLQSQTQDLVVFLKEEPIREFHVAEQLSYMKDLESKYRKIVLSDMLNITRP